MAGAGNRAARRARRRTDAALQDGSKFRPELVVAIVSALGTSVEPVTQSLESAFQAVGYTPKRVRISKLLEAQEFERNKVNGPDDSRSRKRWLMDLGDGLRRRTRWEPAAAALAIAEIQEKRAGDIGEFNPRAGGVWERSGVVTILRSLKRPEEIATLRSVYGPRLLVLGVSSSRDDRSKAVLSDLKREHPGRSTGWYAKETAKLLARDQQDDTFTMGQRLRGAFSLCDAYVWLRSGHDADGDIARLVRLWFGHPFETPTRDEQAMYYAAAAQYRSAASGRQVGAAVVDSDGELLMTGTNDVPKAGGGQYWPGDDPDYRDFRLEMEMNDRLKYELVMDVLGALRKKWLKRSIRKQDVSELAQTAIRKGGVLSKSRIRDLIEFGRIMHAEMAAICTAARRGTPIGGAALYTTTYPCHECARLIIGAGIARVVYIDPYPKSQVEVLFEQQVSGESWAATDKKVVPFVPFEGVAPVLFEQVFTINQRDREFDGRFKPWVPESLAERVAARVLEPPLRSSENAVLRKLKERSVAGAVK